jgi:hypothetical protein
MRILDIADPAQRRRAAEATVAGAVLRYAFANVYAHSSERAWSVTTTPERGTRVFDWDRVQLPWGAVVAVMCDLQALGPIGLRGPAAQWVPDRFVAVEDTVDLLMPGDACPSNALVADVLELSGEEILAASDQLAELRPRERVVMIGHRRERAVRRRYRKYKPCPVSLVAFHDGELVLERQGSLGAVHIAEIAQRHGLELSLATAPGRFRRAPFAMAVR